MSFERLAYSPIVSRPLLRWPGDAKIALWVAPNIEHYEYLPPHSKMRDPWPRMPHPDILGYGGRDYGNRVGLWRMMEVMDKHDIRCTMSLNLAVYEHYPEIMEACEGRGWDLLCHGLYNTRYYWNLEEDQERAEIAECVETWRRLTGRAIPGWFSPAASYTLNTPDLVAEAGIKYYSDWHHDDQPTLLLTRAGDLISVPYQMDINDAMAWRGPVEGEEFAQMIIDHFDCLYRDPSPQGRVMCIALHPYITGLPHRIRHLDRALAHILSHDGVWKATGAQIADWYRDQQPGLAAGGRPMSHRMRGMDHPHYPFSAMPDRPALAWPGGAAVVANVVLYFEHWELAPPDDAVRDARMKDPFADLFPAYRFYTWREYGNRVGVFRILDLLDRLKLPVTVAANADACTRYPELLTMFLDRGYEIAAHGEYATRMISSKMPIEAERGLIARALQALEAATGVRPSGWIGQDHGESIHTPALLAEAGVRYLMDWPNDDQPYVMTAGDGLVSIPIQAEWDDSQLLFARRIPPSRYPDLVNEALEVLVEEGARSGRYFGLHIHPWLLGKPHCFRIWSGRSSG